MTTLELIALLRIKAADTVLPYLFSDDDFTDALSRAQNVFAAETLCLFDSQTVDVLAADVFFNLPERTVWVKSALFGTNLLTLVTQHELDYGYFSLNGAENTGLFSDWRSQTGAVKFLVSDLGPLLVRMVPIPKVDGVVTIERYKLPEELDLATPINPEISEQFHRQLIIGALGYLYENQDADSFDPNRVAYYNAQWEIVLHDAKVQLQTALRSQERRLSLPDTVIFKQGNGNMNGSEPNDNTLT